MEAPPGARRRITLKNGENLSTDVLDISEARRAVLFVPTIVSAVLTFQASPDGKTGWVDVYNEDGTTETSIGASTGARAVTLPERLCGFNFLRLRSGTSAAPVVQGADRIFDALLKGS